MSTEKFLGQILNTGHGSTIPKYGTLYCHYRKGQFGQCSTGAIPRSSMCIAEQRLYESKREHCSNFNWLACALSTTSLAFIPAGYFPSVKILRESSFQNDARQGEISDPTARQVSTVHTSYMHIHWCQFSTDSQQNQTFNRPHVACNAERERDCRPTGLHK